MFRMDQMFLLVTASYEQPQMGNQSVARKSGALIGGALDMSEQVSEPPKKLMKWRKKLAKPKNSLNILLPGRTLTMRNFAFKVRVLISTLKSTEARLGPPVRPWGRDSRNAAVPAGGSTSLLSFLPAQPVVLRAWQISRHGVQSA